MNDSRIENLGPAEKLLTALIEFNSHLVHNRVGVVVNDPTSPVGVKWLPAAIKDENGSKVVYTLAGRKPVLFGNLSADNKITKTATTTVIGRFQPAGIFEEVAAYMYRQIADVYKLDNEFAAKWASYSFDKEHRDLKVLLAAFMLVQNRKGAPVTDNGKVAFYDDDFRDVGEAMLLTGNTFNPKLLLRVREILTLPSVVKINHELGFGNSAKNPFLGRWPKVAEKWLRYREDNPRLLEGLVKAGFKTTVANVARSIGYKPSFKTFFTALRWKQVQAKDGRRSIAIGDAIAVAETWEGLTETQICEKIVSTKPNFKRIVGMLPKEVGLTRAVVAAAIDAKCLSDRDMIIYTPTIEELGLLTVPAIKKQWEAAIKTADDMRAANIAVRAKSKETKEALQEVADKALQKQVEEVTRNMRVYFMVDISGSMSVSINEAKVFLAKFLQGFPPERIHISTFNTTGREIKLKQNSAAGVNNAFVGISASGGTDYGAGINVLKNYRPAPDEDVIFIFVGDEEASTFESTVRASGLNPLAFGFLKVRATVGAAGYRATNFADTTAVRETARRLGIPCFMIDANTFEDPYAIPRTIKNLIAATPVSAGAVAAPVKRVTLIDTILATKLLQKPAWA